MTRTRTDHSMLDVSFRSLADSRRRFVLSYLLDGRGESVSFEELVDGVVDAETHSLPPDRRSVERTLDHNHLPMLAEQGLIEYDRGHGVVRTTGRTSQIEPYLEVVEDIDRLDTIPA